MFPNQNIPVNVGSGLEQREWVAALLTFEALIFAIPNTA